MTDREEFDHCRLVESQIPCIDHKLLRNRQKFGKTAVTVHAEHLQFAAAIGLAASAGAAVAAVEIGHDAYRLPALKRALRVRFRDLAGNLVADDARVGEIGLGASENVIIGPAHSDAADADQNLAGKSCGLHTLPQCEHTWFFADNDVHSRSLEGVHRDVAGMPG